MLFMACAIMSCEVQPVAAMIATLPQYCHVCVRSAAVPKAFQVVQCLCYYIRAQPLPLLVALVRPPWDMFMSQGGHGLAGRGCMHASTTCKMLASSFILFSSFNKNLNGQLAVHVRCRLVGNNSSSNVAPAKANGLRPGNTR